MSIRPHLLHVMPTLEVSGCYTTMLTWISELRSLYAHTVLFEGDLAAVDPKLLWTIHSHGADILHSDSITPESIDNADATGAILYNVKGHVGIGKLLPTIYYSYGIYDPAPGESVIVAASDYANTHRLDGTVSENLTEHVIPPTVQSRGLRQLRGEKSKFRVGLITSGANAKYPCGTAVKLLGRLPKECELLITTLPKYEHPGMALALDSRSEAGTLRRCTLTPLSSLRYMLACDVLIFGSSGKYFEPFGRGALEAMAMRKAVLCENRGNYPNLVQHGVNGLLYDNLDMALEYISELRADPPMARKLGTNAQMAAGWYDTSVRIGELKRLLRKIGA